jgi:hypothetical protein
MTLRTGSAKLAPARSKVRSQHFSGIGWPISHSPLSQPLLASSTAFGTLRWLTIPHDSRARPRCRRTGTCCRSASRAERRTGKG